LAEFEKGLIEKSSGLLTESSANIKLEMAQVEVEVEEERKEEKQAVDV